MDFLEKLAEKNIIKKDDIPSIKKEIEESGSTLEDILMERGVNPKSILPVKGEFFNIPVQDLGDRDVPFEILEYIPEESASHYGFVPLDVKDNVLEVGIINPDRIEARDALQFISAKVGMPIKTFLISPQDFNHVIENYSGLTGEVTKALSELETELKDTETGKFLEEKKEEDKESVGKKAPSPGAKIVEDAPVTKIVAVILRHATEGNASDVHIEHMGESVRVRFRVDGVLYTSLVLPASVHNAVVARIKILSNLKLDEKRKPQDGRFSARIEGRKIDFRVSTFPAYYGEKVVMRILDSEKGLKPLDAMGFNPEHLKMVREALDRSYGMILITGPTGSGKTTTLYAMLNELDKEKENVVSLEDPVEYNIPGMSQSQVRPEIDYTFANGLRSILRQDPDIIMVGEIRDKETAQLAIQAALTGHLVLATLHTNTAAGAIPRLIDMGVDPYLIAPTLVLTMAQRLVKTMCPESKKPLPLTDSMKMMVEKQFADLPDKFKKEILKFDHFYEAVSTPECPAGTRGRTAVFEVIPIDKDIEQTILTNPVEPEVWKAARQKGALSFKEDAILRAFKGEIPFEEINNV